MRADPFDWIRFSGLTHLILSNTSVINNNLLDMTNMSHVNKYLIQFQTKILVIDNFLMFWHQSDDLNIPGCSFICWVDIQAVYVKKGVM